MKIKPNEETVGIGADLKRMIDLFGPKMYGADMPDVTAKELLQNSFDAIKAAYGRGDILPGKGLITITFDTEKKTLAFDDNGAGMSPEVVKSAFLTIAGTSKDDLTTAERSGGFGLAKLAFIFGNDGLKLKTVRDGIETTLDTNSKELLDGKANLVTRVVSSETKPGTHVEVKFPKTVKNNKGETVAPSLPWSARGFGILSKPLIGDVQVDAVTLSSGSKPEVTTLPIGRNQVLGDTKKVSSAHFPWGDVDVYMGPELQYSGDHRILSSGLYQYSVSIPRELLGWNGLPYDIILDVKPTVEASDAQYPFNNQRENWSPKVIGDVGQLYSFFQRRYAADQARKTGGTFARVEEMPTTTLGGWTKPKSPYEFADVGLTQFLPEAKGFDMPAQIYIKDGKTLIGGKAVDSTASLREDAKLKLENFQFDPAVVPDDLPYFHSNLNVDIVAEAEKAEGVKQASARYFLSRIGTLVQDFRDQLARLPGGYSVWGTAGHPVGISLDKDYHGVHVRVPYDGFFLNPLAVNPELTLDEAIAASWLHTLFHEAAHTFEPNHSEAFTAALAKLDGQFSQTHPGAKHRLELALTDAVKSHRAAFDGLRKVFNAQSTKNVAASGGVEQRVEEPGEPSGVPGRALSRREAERGEPGIRGRDTEGAEPSNQGRSVQGSDEGVVRLYRAEPSVKADHPDWVRDSLAENGHSGAEGRWFTQDQEALDWYKKDINPEGKPHVVYIDVPASELEKYRVSNVPDAKRFSRDPENEFFVPRDVAETKQPLFARPKVPQGWGTVDTTPDEKIIRKNSRGQPLKGVSVGEATPEENQAIEAVNKLIHQLAPRAPVQAMRTLSIGGYPIHGAVFHRMAKRLIAWALESTDVLNGKTAPITDLKGTARHEVVHWLRGEGYFYPEEWNALERRAERKDWIGKHQIEARYPSQTHDKETQLEEAIAEEARERRAKDNPDDPSVVRRAFRRLVTLLNRLKAVIERLFGKVSAEEVFRKMESGEVGAREPNPIHGRPAPQRGEVKAQTPDEDERVMAQRPAPPGTPQRRQSATTRFVTKALGEIPDSVGKKAARLAGRFIPDTIKDATEQAKIGIAPMAAGTPRARAEAKDFANAMRAIRYEWGQVDEHFKKTFTPEQRKRMWEAADEESVMRQQSNTGEREAWMGGRGLDRMSPSERAAVEEVQARADAAFEEAKDLGMTRAEGLPYYVPRMVIEMTAEGPQRVGRREPGTSGVGANLKTSTANLKQRKHMTTEETEAAAKEAFGEDAEVVKDIRTLVLATMKLEQAIAGRTLIEKIKQIGDEVGVTTVQEGSTNHPEDYFTMPEHPAFRIWGPEFEKNDEGNVVPKRYEDGSIVFKASPLYVSNEFKGPLNAVLSKPSGELYKNFMALKGKTMSVIMYSPLMHNAVIWGKAIPADPRGVLFGLVYFRGNRARHDRETMMQAITAGLDPIGRRYFNQDLSTIAEEPQLVPGRSLTAKTLAFVPGLFDPEKGEAVKRAIDKAGDFWHNTLLWDRIADLQMGLYTTIRDKLIRQGYDELTSQRIAAHFANRYAGVLPMEAMSKLSRQTANVALFSRSFTLGNIGAMKDAVMGLPKDLQAQILRDAGEEGLTQAQGAARRKAGGMVLMDIALSYVGLWLGAMVANWLAGNLAPTQMPWENEPDKEQRFLIGYQDDGTALYGRLPTGKVGEEMQDWATMPLDELKRKLSPAGRLLYELAANDKGFGRKLYNPNATTPLGILQNFGAIGWAVMDSVLPTATFDGLWNLLSGKGEKKTAIMQTVMPLAGITVSKGAPGGPAVGEYYRAQEEHNFQVQQQMPAIRDKIRNGDVAGAQKDMTALGIPAALRNYYVRTTQHPELRLSPRALHNFNLYATPEQREQLQRARDASKAAKP
jgi:hypothetical protein